MKKRRLLVCWTPGLRKREEWERSGLFSVQGQKGFRQRARLEPSLEKRPFWRGAWVYVAQSESGGMELRGGACHGAQHASARVLEVKGWAVARSWLALRVC